LRQGPLPLPPKKHLKNNKRIGFKKGLGCIKETEKDTRCFKIWDRFGTNRRGTILNKKGLKPLFSSTL
jgi:hypothetical protein